jgi:hypothetical protein
MGDSRAQVSRPEIKESGTPEGVLHTAAITQNCGRKKSACNPDRALLRLYLLGRLNPVAEFAAADEL